MQGFLANLFSTFFLGLLTPLTAVCVLPLYPGFLSFLSQKMTSEGADPKRPLPLGLMVVAGAISFMMILGLIFTTLLEVSLTGVVGIVSPIAFGALTVVSLLLILNVDIGRLMPGIKTPQAHSPLFSAFLFGFFCENRGNNYGEFSGQFCAFYRFRAWGGIPPAFLFRAFSCKKPIHNTFPHETQNDNKQGGRGANADYFSLLFDLCLSNIQFYIIRPCFLIIPLCSIRYCYLITPQIIFIEEITPKYYVRRTYLAAKPRIRAMKGEQ